MRGGRVVILGGGFGGLDVVRSIGRSRVAREYWDTVLIDKENFFQFNPLLPAVAVGAVETRHIVYPLREAARHRRVRFLKNKAMAIDLERRVVRLHNDLEQPWDVLVIAVGSITHDYGVPGALEYARPFKTIVDAMWLRARVVELFEMAEQAESVAQRRRLLSFAIVGGGITGVEVAAELADMALDTLLPRYPSLRREDLSIVVLEGGDRITAPARPEHSAFVQRHLERHGVVVRLGARVTRVEPRRLWFADGTSLEAFTLLWTAGVQPPPLVRELPLAHVPDGRVIVDEHLRAVTTDGAVRDDVFVIGDCAASQDRNAHLLSQLAQTAEAMGHHVGEFLVAKARGRTVKPFRFEPEGYVISLGKRSSVVELFGIPMSGQLAWLIWAAAYLVKMVGIRKQLEVGIDHLTHLFFEHDSSQILNRRQILTDEELDMSLREADGAGGDPPASGAAPRAAGGQAVAPPGGTAPSGQPTGAVANDGTRDPGDSGHDDGR